jgi:hypothetical protein
MYRPCRRAGAVCRLRQERGPERGTVLMDVGVVPGPVDLHAADLLRRGTGQPDAGEQA